jgi:hypothetical protein
MGRRRFDFSYGGWLVFTIVAGTLIWAAILFFIFT